MAGSGKNRAARRRLRAQLGAQQPQPSELSRESVMAFIGENPAKANKRDIAKAFGVRGEQRKALKSILNGLRDDGIVHRQKKHLVRQGTLPAVGVINIITRDRNGELIGLPAKWDERDGKPPTILIPTPKGRALVGVGDRALARLRKLEDGKAAYRGDIIKKLPKHDDVILGVLAQDGPDFLLEPIKRKQKPLRIPNSEASGGKAGDLVKVAAIRRQRSGLDLGRVEAVVGDIKSEKSVSTIAIFEKEIPHEFSETCLNEAANLKPADLGLREDWRHMPLTTIDPKDAKDHDDAIFAESDPDVENGHIVYVAIADVSWYVRYGSAIDREARIRGNSVYFPDQVVPMLPERISNDLCSLREGEDRAALAVKMHFDASGKKLRHSFHRILMRNPKKLAYEEAQAGFDGNREAIGSKTADKVLAPLWAAYLCLKKGRNARQPLEIDVPERKVILDNAGRVARITVPERLEAHKLVEEFMIQANVAAAETLEAKRQPLIYRIHDRPSLDKQESLREFLKTLDMKLASSSNLRPAHFNAILAHVKGSDHEELVNQIVLRSQSQAEYSPQNIGHFGLNLRKYAHFTSPIRRYADLIVHRALVKALGLGEGGLDHAQELELDGIAAEISMAERRAVQAERDTIDRLVAEFLSGQIGETFEGTIGGVTRAGLFVTLNESGADGFVPISSILNEYFVYVENRHAVVGQDTGTEYRLGQAIDVRLEEAAPVAGALRFSVVAGGLAAKGRSSKRKSGRGHHGKRGAFKASKVPKNSRNQTRR